MNVEKVAYNNQLIAMIIYKEDKGSGAKFYTPEVNTLQIGRHFRNRGEEIKAHKHLPIKDKKNENLQEVLYIEKGKVKVNFYSEKGEYISSKILKKGDMVLLMDGGHSFDFIEDTKMVEVKEGCYRPNCKEYLKTEK